MSLVCCADDTDLIATNQMELQELIDTVLVDLRSLRDSTPLSSPRYKHFGAQIPTELFAT